VAPSGEPREVEALASRFEGRFFVVGVPHFVTRVDDLACVPVAEWGAALRHHRDFGPAGANVDFVAPLGGGSIAMRTYERGVEAETLACGSGAIASALWAAAAGHRSPVRVRTAGGDELIVTFETLADGWDVRLTGPAAISFRGEWRETVPAREAAPAAGQH
jgi:diaminopimelate epimerase